MKVKPNCNIHALVACLRSEFRKPTEQRRICSVFSSFQFNLKEWKAYENFNEDQYVRHLVAFDEDFSLILNCWSKGQESPVHEHGPNTNCWVRVEEGELAIELYDSEDELPKDVVPIPTKSCYVITDSTGLHKTKNVSRFDHAISFHLYSPPYINCCFKKGSSDEINTIPAVYCSSVEGTGRREDLRNTLQFQQRVFTSLQTFTDILKKELDANGHDIPYMSRVISRFNFNPKEWKQYVSYGQGRYTRNLVGYDDKFTLLLLCWDKGRGSPIHDHAGSSCWVKMLEGELYETRYDLEADGNVAVKRKTKMTVDDVCYIDDTLGLHKMENENPDNVAISLHIYSPPYSDCYSFDLATGMKKRVSLKCVHLQKNNSIIQLQMNKTEQPKLSQVGEIIDAIRSEFSGINSTLSLSSFESASTSPSGSLSSSPLSTSPSSSPSSPSQSFLSLSHPPAMYHAPNVDTIEGILNSIVFDVDNWSKFIHFNEHRWTRSLIAFDENFSLVLNCWNKGQVTPVHHHGNDGTCSWSKVMMGEMKVTRYAEKRRRRHTDPSSKSSPVGECSIACGGDHCNEDLEMIETIIEDPDSPAMYMDGAEGLHKTENASSTSPAISLHLYSPPYLECKSYDQSEHFPVVYCNPTQYNCLKGSHGLQYKLQYQEHVYENISTLIDTLKQEFSEDENPCSEKIQYIMKSFQLNPLEWQQYSANCRSLVGADENFSLFLIHWKDGQQTPIHDYNVSKSWTKVLEGEIEETVFVNGYSMKTSKCHLKVLDTTSYKSDSVIYRDKNAIHKSESIGPSVTLHLYSPPCSESFSYNHITGEKKVISVCSVFKMC